MKKNRILKILTVSLVSGLSFSISAQEQEYNFSLQEALTYGLENSLSIRQASMDQDIAEGQIGEIRSSGLPQINGEGQFQNFPNLPTQLLPGEIIGQPGTQIPVQFGTDFTMSGTLKLSQLVYNQQFFTGLKAAKSSRELYQQLRLKTEEDVILAIAQSYYQILETEAQKSVLESNVDRLNQIELLLTAQYENELVTKTDLSRIKVNKVNLETNLKSIQTGIEQQYNYLKLLIGMPMDQQLRIKDPGNLDLVELNNRNSERETPVELMILSTQQELNTLNKKQINAGYAPTLSVFGQQMWQAQRNEFDFFKSGRPWFQQTVIGVQLQVPIFDGLQKHYKVQQVKIEHEKLKLQQTEAERQLDMQLQNAREQYKNSLISVRAQIENKNLAEEVLHQTQLLYKEHIVGLTDLLDSQQSFRDAELNYYRELIRYKKSELEMLKAQGQLKSIINQN